MADSLGALNKLGNEKLIGYFLMLWGLSFILGGLGGLTYAGYYGVLSSIFHVLGSILDIPSGIILIIVGRKIAGM
ncbi:hypothetical protein JXL21_04805 [Candidatus Bathyarchaeota archaeon]|nr:hypothetical protein [Candidatus Bathyarchaeota archaeon]